MANPMRKRFPESQEFVIDSLIEKALGDVDHYFQAPHVMIELLRLVDDPTTTIDSLARTVESDPSLTLNLLRVVNSAAFGFNQTISSIEEAVLLLGFNEVKYICVTRAMKTQFMQRRAGPILIPREKFWHHSVATGVFAKLLASKSGLCDPGTAYVAGMIHDIGWVAIELALPEATQRIIESAEKEQIWPETRELRLLGFSHEGVGAWLVQSWKLPEVFRVVLKYHHHPEKAEKDRELVAVVHLADALGSMCFPFFSDYLIPEGPSQTAWDALGLGPEICDEVMAEFSEEVIQMGELLHLK